MPEIRLDNMITALNHSMLVNRSTGMGTMRDSFTETEVGYVPILGEHELRQLHRGNWWVRRIIDVPAMDMVKAGVTITHPSNDAEAIQTVMGLYEAGGEQSKYSRKMGGAMAFQRAEMYARWFGRGYIVMRVNGNEKLEKPLTKVKSFEGFSVLDRYQLRPANDAINYEDPEFYQIARRYQRGSELKNAEFKQKIHETRVLVFDGAFIHPYDINLESADGAHDSVVQSLYECFCRHYSVQNAIAKGLDSYSLFKVAIANLGELMMQEEGETALTKTLNSIAEMISMHRILVQDGESSNSEFQERTFTGVAENANGFRDELTAASGLPHYKLWGSVDKSGLADSGGAESRAWADTVNSLQVANFKDNHRRVFNALFEASVGSIPDGYGIDYPSIYKATPKEEAELKKTEADTYSTLITAEVLNPLEVKLALATGEEIGNVLDAEAIEAELEKARELAEKQLEVEKAELDQSIEAATVAPVEGEAPARTVNGQVVPDLDSAISQLDSADVVRIDKKKGGKKGKKRNCKKGLSCGNSCISRLKTCRKTPTASQAKLAQQIRDEVVPFERPGATEAQATFGSTDHNVVFEANQYASEVGINVNEADARFNAIERYTGDNYSAIRKSQKNGEDSEDAQKIEAYLATAQKYDGRIYRGVQLNSVDDFYSRYGKDGSIFKESSMNSWTSNTSIANDFAHTNDDRPVAVLFGVQNKSGSSIRNISEEFSEEEVLVPKNAQYRIKRTIVKKDKLGGDLIIVKLEQIDG